MDSISFQQIETKEILQCVSDFIRTGRVLFNNFFGIGECGEYECHREAGTILIRKKEFYFYRLFLISLDEGELTNLLSVLNDEEYVINIPSKSSIENWDKLLRKCGYIFVDVYSRYYNNNIPYYPSSIDTFASLDDLEVVQDLLYNNFSFYTDHLPTKDELKKMIENRQIITDLQDGQICGVMIYSIVGNKGYQNFWIDKGENALALLFKAKNIFLEKGIKYCYYWVRDNNTPVIKIHKLLGGKPDGLKDYTYLKKK